MKQSRIPTVGFTWGGMRDSEAIHETPRLSSNCNIVCRLQMLSAFLEDCMAYS